MYKKYKIINIDELTDFFGHYFNVLKKCSINTYEDLLEFNDMYTYNEKKNILYKYTSNPVFVIDLINNISELVINLDNIPYDYSEYINIYLTSKELKGFFSEKCLKILKENNIYTLKDLFEQSDKPEFIKIGHKTTKYSIIKSTQLIRCKYLNENPNINLIDRNSLLKCFTTRTSTCLKKMFTNSDSFNPESLMSIAKNNLYNLFEEDEDFYNCSKSELRIKLDTIYKYYYEKNDLRQPKILISSYGHKIINSDFIDLRKKSLYSELTLRVDKLNISEEEKYEFYRLIEQIQDSQLEDKKTINKLSLERKIV